MQDLIYLMIQSLSEFFDSWNFFLSYGPFAIIFGLVIIMVVIGMFIKLCTAFRNK